MRGDVMMTYSDFAQWAFPVVYTTGMLLVAFIASEAKKAKIHRLILVTIFWPIVTPSIYLIAFFLTQGKKNETP